MTLFSKETEMTKLLDGISDSPGRKWRSSSTVTIVRKK